MRILIVEDEPTLGKQLKSTLEQTGYAGADLDRVGCLRLRYVFGINGNRRGPHLDHSNLGGRWCLRLRASFAAAEACKHDRDR